MSSLYSPFPKTRIPIVQTTTGLTNEISGRPLPDFSTCLPGGGNTTVVLIPPSPDHQLPACEFLPNPTSNLDEVGGIVTHRRASPKEDETIWQLRQLSLSPKGEWLSKGLDLEGASNQPPRLIGLRPGCLNKHSCLIIQHPPLSLLLPPRLQLVRQNAFAKTVGSLTLHNVVGAAFSGNGQVIALARADGIIYVGKLKEGPTYEDNRSYGAEEITNCLVDFQAYDLALGQDSNGDPGKLSSCSFALDANGRNIFLIANCQAAEQRQGGFFVLVSQRARVWLQRDKCKLSAVSCASGQDEDWALGVTCYDPPVPEPVIEKRSPPAKGSRSLPKEAAPAPSPAPAPSALGEGPSGIFSGLRATHVQMGERAPKGAQISPEVENSPYVLTGLRVLDPSTMIDWYPNGVRLLRPLGSETPTMLKDDLLASWRPNPGEQVLSVQVVRSNIYFFVAQATPDSIAKAKATVEARLKPKKAEAELEGKVKR